MCSLRRQESVLQDLSEKALLDAEIYHNEHDNFSDETLRNLHSIYGETLEDALDVLDRGKTVRYRSDEDARYVYVTTVRNRRFVLYEDINFCFCPEFKECVLKRTALTCRHVLALRLARIARRVAAEETLKRGTFVELMNNARLFADD